MNMKQNNRKALSIASLAGIAAVALTIALPANAVDFKVSGQVHRALTIADNGKESDVGFVDSTSSNSRFRFVGSEDLGNGNTIGLTYEIGLTDNTSDSWDIKSNRAQAGSGNSFVDNRLANIWVQGDWGRVEFGKLWDPGSGTTELEYSGTVGLGGGSDINDYAGGLTWVTKGDKYATGISSYDVSDEMDGIGRSNGVVYYTPDFSGFSAGVMYADAGRWEVVPRYEMSFGDGGKFGVSALYANNGDNGKMYTADGRTALGTSQYFRQYGLSAAVLLPSGFNASAAWQQRKFKEGLKVKTYYGSVGYRFGQHNIAASYMQTNDMLSVGEGQVDASGNITGTQVGKGSNDQYNSRYKAYGIAYTYNFNDSIDLYTSYHMYKLKGKGRQGNADLKFENINHIYSGIVVRFL